MKRICGLFLLAFGLAAQDAAPKKFEVVSIRPGAPVHGDEKAVTYDPGRLRLRNVPMMFLLTLAYDLKFFQIEAPNWTEQVCFDVEAVPPAGAGRKDLHGMTRAMLEERFGLRAHFEDRKATVYALVVASKALRRDQADGSAVFAKRLKESMPFEYPLETGQWMSSGRPGGGYLVAKAISNTVLASALGETMQAAVEDRTGVADVTDRLMFFSRDEAGARDGNTEKEAYPDLRTALREQLGLELKPERVTVRVLVIDQLARESSAN